MVTLLKFENPVPLKLENSKTRKRPQESLPKINALPITNKTPQMVTGDRGICQPQPLGPAASEAVGQAVEQADERADKQIVGQAADKRKGM